MEQQGYIKIDRNGRATIIGDRLQRQLCHQAGYYVLNQIQTDQLTLSRASHIPKFGELNEPIIFQGDIAGIGSTVEVVNFVISARLTGQLIISFGEVRKSLFFKEGSLCAARSNHLDDRLGEILFRYGALEREVIHRAEEESSNQGRPLGNYLIQSGDLTQGQLYLFFKKQVEEIFYSTLLVKQGEFYFTAPIKNEPPTPLKLNAQQMLLEGVKRTDEMKRCQELIPSLELVLSRTDKISSSLDVEYQSVLDRLVQPRSVRDLIEFFRIGELPILQRVTELLERGLLQINEGLAMQQRVSSDEVIMLFNRTFSMLDRFAQAKQITGVLNEALSIFHQIYESPLIENLSFDERGRLDQASLLQRVSELNLPETEGELGETLRELLYFCIFTSRTWLSPEEHKQLQDVYEELAQLTLG